MNPQSTSSTINNAGQRVREAGQELRRESSEASDKLKHMARERLDEMKEFWAESRQELERRIEASEEIVKKYPFYSLAAASAVGLICGFLVGRGRRG